MDKTGNATESSVAEKLVADSINEAATKAVISYTNSNMREDAPRVARAHSNPGCMCEVKRSKIFLNYNAGKTEKYSVKFTM